MMNWQFRKVACGDLSGGALHRYRYGQAPRNVVYRNITAKYLACRKVTLNSSDLQTTRSNSNTAF